MRKTYLLLALAVLILSALLAGCGATGEPEFLGSVSDEQMAYPTQAPEPPGEAEKAIESEAVDADAEAPTASGSNQLVSLTSPRVERMIIKNAEMDLLVADTDTALDSVTLIATEYGGYLISSHSWFENGFKYATVRLGVPVLEFENVMRRLRGLAIKVNSELASGEDVTDQFVDLQSRLTNLEATRDRIREFLDKAETVEEALKVNEQLSQVEAQIEEIQGRMNYLKDRSAYSTIDVKLNPQRPTPTPSPTPTPTPTPTPEAWRPGETVEGATNTLTSILKGLIELGIWIVIVLGPFLIPLALIIWLIVWWQRRKGRQASPPEPTPPAEPPEAETTES